ncbi:MAG TPA: hypothetical protein VEY12_01835 [Thermoplasmata archaeon]|nr:hypothetical protein [Thermoplasmata archaeon]
MASGSVPERDLRSTILELHDYLWAGARPDEAKLLARLERGARNLDRHLGTKGRVERAIRPMTRHFRKVTHGADLFTFLQAVAQLSFAADRVRRAPQDSVKASSQLAYSLCVHLASVMDRHDLTQSFESGRTDFASYSSKLADALEERGVLRAGEFRRAANQAFDLHALWDRRASVETQRIVALTAVASGGFACVLFVDALKALSRHRETPYGHLVPVVAAIFRRLGGQP